MSRYLRAAGYALVTTHVVLLLGLTLMDQDWGMNGGWLMLTWLAGTGTTLVLLVAWAGICASGASGASRDWPHALVPLLLAVVAPVLVAAGGPARDRAQTTALWLVVALLTHAALTVLTAGQRAGWIRTASIVALPLVLVAAVGVERARQVGWRAHDFLLVGVPLVVPEVPGYVLSRTAPGRSSVYLILYPHNHGPTPGLDESIEAAIGRITPGGSTSCQRTAPDRFSLDSQATGGHTALVFCLAGHEFQMWLTATGHRAPDLEPLLDRITLRQVTATYLARYPAGWTWEAD